MFPTAAYRWAHMKTIYDRWLRRAGNCVGKNLTQYWSIWQYMRVLGAQGLLLGIRAFVLETLAQVRQLQL